MEEKDSYYYYCQARDRYLSGLYDEALIGFFVSLTMTEHFRTYMRIADCFAKRGEEELSLHYSGLAYTLAPNSNDAAFAYAAKLAERGSGDKAVPILEMIADRAPDWKKAKDLLNTLTGNDETDIDKYME